MQGDFISLARGASDTFSSILFTTLGACPSARGEPGIVQRDAVFHYMLICPCVRLILLVQFCHPIAIRKIYFFFLVFSKIFTLIIE